MLISKRILSPININSNNSIGSDLEDMLKLLADAYPAAYKTLHQAKPITCSVTGTIFDSLPAPCAVILDVSLLVYCGRQ